ncbi:MAG: hypothetical protein ACUZ8E_03945 [Candidatus Anammoxibacter sp.]
MSTVTKDKKVSDMTAGELQELIRGPALELIDPDYGLELRSEVEEELEASIKSTERIPAKDLAKKLGVKW